MWHGGSLLLAGLAGACSFALGDLARAQSVFEVPEECGSEAEFRSELDRLIGTAAAEALPVQLVIARSVLDPTRYTLRLQMGGEIRELEDADCRTLLRSAVVIAAAAARTRAPSAAEGPPAATQDPPATEFAEPPPPAALSPSPSSPANAPSPAPPGAVPAPSVAGAPPPSALTPPARPAPRDLPPSAVEGRVSYALSAGLGVTGGVLPGAAAALELGGSVEPTPWGLAVSFRYWPEKGRTLDGRSLSVSAFGGRVAGLFSLSAPVQLTLGLDINLLSGTGGESVSRRGSDAAWHVAPSAGFVAIPWSIGHLRLELSLLGHVSLVRPHFLVIGFGDVYEVPKYGGSAIVRGAWLFP